MKCIKEGDTYHKTRAWSLWINLESRTTNQIHRDACYTGVLNKFTDFQEFASWCQVQEGYERVDERNNVWQLDKDLLGDGTAYSPEVCVFVPAKLNSMLIEQKSLQGLLPGVSYSGNKSRFVARGRPYMGNRKHLGTFNTEQEAHEAYLRFKRDAIAEALQVLDLPEKVTEVLKSSWNI